MSRGHGGEPKSPALLTKMSGECDTPELLAKRYKLDTDHGIAYAGGISVDGSTVYIDKRLYEEILRRWRQRLWDRPAPCDRRDRAPRAHRMGHHGRRQSG